MFPRALLVLTLLTAASLARAADTHSLEKADQAAEILAAALQSDPADGDKARHLQDASQRAAELLGDGWRAAEALQRVPEVIASPAGLRGGRDLMLRVRDDLRFRPMMEAELPAGFPTPTLVNEIQVKQYGVYRLARVTETGGRNGRFMMLFRHIQKHDIPMTAPVEMTMSEPSRNAETSMAFLYPSTATGATGPDDGVEVLDSTPHTVVSIGIRGRLTNTRMQEATGHLEGWLATHADTWQRDGEIRVMGFNSPFVRDSRQFSEVQIPIRPVKP